MKTVIKKSLAYAALTASILFSITANASAHVVVNPAEVLTAGFETFTIGVPNEKSVATTGTRLVMPAGLKHVTPTAKPGWVITVEKAGEGEEATVTAINWTGSTIEPGFRDEFTFSAQVPAEAIDLQWKAYQTYGDGLTVAWDKSEADQPKKADGSPDFSTAGPFSSTKVVAETAYNSQLKTLEQATVDAKSASRQSRYIAIAALVIAVAGFAIATRKK